MRYCANEKCLRKDGCLRYTLGKKFVAEEDYGHCGWRKRRQGNWVYYRNAEECDQCQQYIDKNYKYKSHPK